MDSCLEHDPCGLVEEEDDGGGIADASVSGPALCCGVVDACLDVI